MFMIRISRIDGHRDRREIGGASPLLNVSCGFSRENTIIVMYKVCDKKNMYGRKYISCA